MHALKIAWNKFEKAVVPTFSRLVTNSINAGPESSFQPSCTWRVWCWWWWCGRVPFLITLLKEYSLSRQFRWSSATRVCVCVCVDLCCALVSGLCQPNQRLLRSRPLLEGRGSLPWRTLCGVVSTEIVLLWWDRRMALLLVLISFFSNYKTSFYGEIFSNAAKWCQDWFGLVMSTKKELKLSNKW